jgi:dTDP-glucose 4,6-dehydratase
LRAVLARGRIGETYNVGGNSEKTNLDVVKTICTILDELRPAANPRISLLSFVKDRPGHDRRYALDAGKLARELGWRPQERFDSGMRKTIAWYLDNPQWIENVVSGSYRNWLATNYEQR